MNEMLVTQILPPPWHAQKCRHAMESLSSLGRWGLAQLNPISEPNELAEPNFSCSTAKHLKAPAYMMLEHCMLTALQCLSFPCAGGAVLALSMGTSSLTGHGTSGCEISETAGCCFSLFLLKIFQVCSAELGVSLRGASQCLGDTKYISALNRTCWGTNPVIPPTFS